MDSKVNLRLKKLDVVKDYPFAHAQEILRLDKYNDFECADDNHEFINNELIKRASDKAGTKPAKSKRSSKGRKVSK
jgi:hypothetical protein